MNKPIHEQYPLLFTLLIRFCEKNTSSIKLHFISQLCFYGTILMLWWCHKYSIIQVDWGFLPAFLLTLDTCCLLKPPPLVLSQYVVSFLVTFFKDHGFFFISCFVFDSFILDTTTILFTVQQYIHTICRQIELMAKNSTYVELKYADIQIKGRWRALFLGKPIMKGVQT